MKRTAYEDDVIIANLNHKINRKAMIARMIDEQWDRASEEHYENWILEDEYIEKALACEQAFAETLETPVGGAVSRYII